MADASAVTPPSGLFGDAGFNSMRAALNALIETDIPKLRYHAENSVILGITANSVATSITDTANGAFRLLHSVAFKVGGAQYVKAGSATAKLWDLSAEAVVGAAEWRSYRLFLTSGGTASFTSGGTGASAAAALALLDSLTLETDKSVIADYAAAPSTSFSADSLSGVSGAVIRMGFGTPISLASYPVRW